MENGKLMKVDVGADLEGIVGKETTNICTVSGGSELDHCSRCFELEEKRKKAEKRCNMLELEIEKNKFELESLEGKLSTVTLDKLVLEDEVCRLEKGNRELQNKITDFRNNKANTSVEVKDTQDTDIIEKGDKLFELMVENNALNAEVGVLEAKCKDLEFQVAVLEKSLNTKANECPLTGMVKLGTVSSGGDKEMQSGICGAATPVIDTLFSNVVHEVGAKSDILHENEVGCVSRARKKLIFEEGIPSKKMRKGIPSKKMTPKTPAHARPLPLCPIDISDSDDEANTINLPVLDIQAGKRASGLSDDDNVFSTDGKELTSKNNVTLSPIESEEDDLRHCNRRTSSMLNAKRKRAPNVISSDSGSDTDDNFPICRLRKDHLPESTLSSLQKSNYIPPGVASGNKDEKPIPRRRLVPLRKQYKEGSNETRSLCGIPTYGTFKGDETEEGESDGDDESLNGFIVSSSDSEGDTDSGSKVNVISTSDERSTAESDDASDGNMDYREIISRIGRKKDCLMIKWVFEADMLAAFGKDPELCMKAVCALYRKQTSEERLSKATLFANQRGFSQCDAVRGSKLGEFLTDGDPMGDLKKSVKELQEHDPKGIEMCRQLATHYSKQLYAMYENKEDPLWPAMKPN